MENESAVEHFMKILPLKKAGADSTHSALIEWLERRISCATSVVGMVFDGAATLQERNLGFKHRTTLSLFTATPCHKL